jgi:hypothetical protein
VFKGYGLPKEAKEYLSSHGLNNAAYSIQAPDVQNDLFGKLLPCPFQVSSNSLLSSVFCAEPHQFNACIFSGTSFFF